MRDFIISAPATQEARSALVRDCLAGTVQHAEMILCQFFGGKESLALMEEAKINGDDLQAAIDAGYKIIAEHGFRLVLLDK